MPAKNKVISRLLSLWIARTKTGTALSTTLTANAAKGATSLTVAAITNAADGDAIRIGSGNEMELNRISGAPSGSTIPLAWPLQRAHVIGEDAKEMTVYDHGAPDENGADVYVTGEVQDIMVANQRLPLTNIKGYMSAGVEGAWPFVDLNTFVTAIGALLTRLSGSGTVVSPRQYITDGNDFGEESDLAVIASGVLVDGTFVYCEMWGCSMNYSALGRVQLRRGQTPRLSFRARASAGGVVTTVAPGYTIDSTLKAQKSQAWRALSEVGFRVPAGSGVNTTLSAPAAAGATVLSVVSETGGAAGDRVKVGTGSDAEYPIIASVAAGSITLRTKLLRGHVTGETVVEQTTLILGSVSEEGVGIEFGGTLRTIRLGHTPLEAGDIPGDASILVSFNLVEISLANLAYALGIPQTDIASNRLPVDVNIGTADIDAVYLKGVLQNGDTFELDAWGAALQLNDIRVKIANQGVASIPIVAKPASLQILQYQ